MHPKNRKALAARVAQAAAAALKAQGYVCTIDVMLGIGWLTPRKVLEWRTRQLPFLERGIQSNLKRISEAMRLFAAWAQKAGLRPSTTDYVARTAGRERLRFSKSGEPAIEKARRTHWVSAKLSKAKRARVQAKAEKPPDLVAIDAQPGLAVPPLRRHGRAPGHGAAGPRLPALRRARRASRCSPPATRC